MPYGYFRNAMGEFEIQTVFSLVKLFENEKIFQANWRKKHHIVDPFRVIDPVSFKYDMPEDSTDILTEEVKNKIQDCKVSELIANLFCEKVKDTELLEIKAPDINDFLTEMLEHPSSHCHSMESFILMFQDGTYAFVDPKYWQILYAEDDNLERRFAVIQKFPIKHFRRFWWTKTKPKKAPEKKD